MTTAIETGIARVLRVCLAPHEWGNELMASIARDAFRTGPDLDVVDVIEHAGWYLSFLRDGTIIGTANDAAILSPRAIDFIREHRHWDFVGRHNRD